MKFTLCKKQYLYLALAVISMLLAVATRAFAQDAVPATYSSPDAPPNGAPVNQMINARKEPVVAFEDPKQNRIINLARNVIGKMQSATNRMEQIITRIDARIVILKSTGVNTAQAETSLMSSVNSLKSAKEMLASLDSSVISTITSENPRESFKTTKFQFSVVREALRSTHTNLKNTVTSLKEAVKASEQPSGASDAVQNPQSLEEKTSPESTQ